MLSKLLNAYSKAKDMPDEIRHQNSLCIELDWLVQDLSKSKFVSYR